MHFTLASLVLAAAASAAPLSPRPNIVETLQTRNPALDIETVNKVTRGLLDDISAPIVDSLPVDIKVDLALLDSVKKRALLNLDLGDESIGLKPRSLGVVDTVNKVTGEVSQITQPLTDSLPVDVDVEVAPGLLKGLGLKKRAVNIDIGDASLGLKSRSPGLTDAIGDLTKDLGGITKPIGSLVEDLSDSLP